MSDNTDSPPQDSSRLQLRPGAQIFAISADEVQIIAVNHSTTFTSIPVVQIVLALVEALADSPTRKELSASVAEQLEEKLALVDYVAELMRNTGCIVTRSPAEGDEPAQLDARGEFYASLGLNPETVAATLAEASPVIISPSPSAPMIVEALARVGISGALIEAAVGSPCGDVLDNVREALKDSEGPLVIWDVPWRMPFARLLNEFAIENDRPILFGVCEGAVGRLGPYVLPRNTPCLECVQTRILANAGDNEIRVASSYRTRLSDSIPPPLPAHPAFRQALANLLAIELSQITLSRPPITLGGYIEYQFGAAGGRRHPALKVPRCPACYSNKPARIAWNARFPAPLVKSGAA